MKKAFITCLLVLFVSYSFAKGGVGGGGRSAPSYGGRSSPPPSKSAPAPEKPAYQSDSHSSQTAVIPWYLFWGHGSASSEDEKKKEKKK